MIIYRLTIRSKEDGKIITVSYYKNKSTVDKEKNEAIKGIESILKCNINTLYYIDLDELDVNEN